MVNLMISIKRNEAKLGKVVKKLDISFQAQSLMSWTLIFEVPDQVVAITANPFHALIQLSCQGQPQASLRHSDDHFRLQAHLNDDVQERLRTQKVNGLLLDLQRWCRLHHPFRRIHSTKNNWTQREGNKLWLPSLTDALKGAWRCDIMYFTSICT